MNTAQDSKKSHDYGRLTTVGEIDYKLVSLNVPGDQPQLDNTEWLFHHFARDYSDTSKADRDKAIEIINSCAFFANATAKDGNSLLHYAMNNGHKNVIEHLMGFADIAFSENDIKAQPVHMGIIGHQANCVKIAVTKEPRTGMVKTPLLPMFLAALTHQFELAGWLMNFLEIQDVNYKVSTYNNDGYLEEYTLLSLALQENNIKTMVYALDQNADIFFAPANNLQAIHIAAEYASNDTLKAFLEHPKVKDIVNLNAVDDGYSFDTPLNKAIQAAIKEKSIAKFNTLMDAGASPDKPCKPPGCVPPIIITAVESIEKKSEESQKLCFEMFDRLFKEGANPNAQKDNPLPTNRLSLANELFYYTLTDEAPAELIPLVLPTFLNAGMKLYPTDICGENLVGDQGHEDTAQLLLKEVEEHKQALTKDLKVLTPKTLDSSILKRAYAVGMLNEVAEKMAGHEAKLIAAINELPDWLQEDIQPLVTQLASKMLHFSPHHVVGAWSYDAALSENKSRMVD